MGRVDGSKSITVHNMKPGSWLLGATGIFAFLGPAPAQVVSDFTGAFVPSNWAICAAGDSGAVFSHNTTLHLTGPNDDGGAQTVSVAISVPSTGTIGFAWSGTTADLDGWTFDPVGFSVNGVFTPLSPPEGYGLASGTENVPVTRGQAFAFAIQSMDSGVGASQFNVTGFQFVPVPEPAGWAGISSTGLLLFAAWRRRRSRLLAH